MSSRNDQLWTTVAETAFPHEAHLIATMLNDNEIDTVLKDEHFSSMYPGASIALGGVKVQVQTDRVEEARAILDANNNANLEPPITED